ncbi:MAG: hypothetical protein V1911_00865 [Candidatus Micrarchaeota archaeon]
MPADKMQSAIRHGVVIDTNVLFDYLVGLYIKNSQTPAPSDLKSDPEDFKILDRILPLLSLSITPHVLTETYALLKIRHKTRAKEIMKNGLNYLLKISEINVHKDSILLHSLFEEVGVADTALINCSEKEKYYVLTDEKELRGRMESRNMNVLGLDNLYAFYYNLPGPA